MSDRYRILVIEDNRADVFLIREAITHAGIPSDLEWLEDGEKAIDFIAQKDSNDETTPDLILLDLNLPKRTGHEVLRYIRNSRRCARTPVLIVTSSDSEKDRNETVSGGATDYFRKPATYVGFLKLGEAVRTLLEQETPGNPE